MGISAKAVKQTVLISVWGEGSLSENIDFCTTCDLSSCNAESADVRGLEPDLTFVPVSSSFTIWAVLFVLGRLLTLSLSVLTVGFGLVNAENQGFDLATGNFNVLFVR